MTQQKIVENTQNDLLLPSLVTLCSLLTGGLLKNATQNANGWGGAVCCWYLLKMTSIKETEKEALELMHIKL